MYVRLTGGGWVSVGDNRIGLVGSVVSAHAGDVACWVRFGDNSRSFIHSSCLEQITDPIEIAAVKLVHGI